jgi:hypothetical protein
MEPSMKNGRAAGAIGVAIAALLLAGCTHDPTQPIGAPVLDSQFGNAVKRAKAMQVIRPEGIEVNDESYSGSAAQRAMDRYSNNGVPPAPNSAPSNGAPPLGAPVKAPQ